MSAARRYWALALVLGACQRHPAERAPAPAAVASPQPVPVAAAALPEDAAAGERSVAQWREHLEEEERERKLRFDRRKLPEHKRVSQLIRAAQQAYDRAPTERAVTAAQKSFQASLPRLEKSFDALDHHGESSGLVPEYRKLVELFTGGYPSARIAALAGSRASLGEVEARAKTHFETIDEWLKEAARDDGDE